jgi:hypothetical protein
MSLNQSIFVIPAGEAEGYTKAWRTQKNLNPTYAKAFTIKIQELEDLLAELKGMPQADAVRVYLAIKPTPAGDDMETIILCGVNGFNPDRGANGTDIVTYKAANGEEVSGCFDFNFPCPTTCDVNSPLYS